MMIARFFSLVLSAAAVMSFSTCRTSQDPQTSTGGSGAPLADVQLAGVDTAALTPRERREWSAYVQELLSPCNDTPVSIAQCVKEKRSCARCLPAARFLAKEVREGRTRDQAIDGYKARFDNDKVKKIDVSDSPTKGPATAPITVVEWADFECPFCKRAYPVLDQMIDRYPGKIRLVYKVYPLSMHPHAEPAARAAIAAGDQGQCWEMHHLLFEHAPALEEADLEKYAKQLGLDVAKFKADMASEATTKKIEKDKKDAEALGFQGTPLIYIDGREFEPHGDLQAELDDWIHEELEMMGETVPPIPKSAPVAPGSASAAPASSGSKK